jgi:tetratricopeptide (TPR) repeat protein
MLARALKLEGEDSPRVATFRHSLAETLVEVGKFVEAETLERSALGTLNKQYAASEPPVVNARAVLGMSLAGQRRYAEAEPLLLDACTKIRESSQLGLQRRVLFMSSCRSLTGVLVAGGKPEMASEWQPFTEAETLARAMLARVMEQEGDTSWNASNWRLNLAEALRKVGRFGEAERYARECVQIRQTQTSANNVWLAFALVSLGATLAGC